MPTLVFALNRSNCLLARILLACALALFASTVRAADALIDAIISGTPLADVRLRFEDVRQAGKAKEASATTARARLGYQTGRYRGLNVLAEFDFLQHFGPEHFNDTINGRILYPTIADPDMAALNRLQLNYSGSLFAAAESNTPDFSITAGRQRIFFGDGRFIGNAEWRQHEQTFDAVTVAETPLSGTTLTYSYVARVNRVFGPDSSVGHFDSHSHLFNAIYGGLLPMLKLEGYAYLLDLKQAPGLSTATYGLRGDGTFGIGNGWSLRLNGAYADQTDYAHNPLHYDLSYYLAEGGLAGQGLILLGGYEVFQGNGLVAVQTPLANLHPFNGWAESFLTKPPNGLEDGYFKASYTLSPLSFFNRVTAALAYHDFSAERIDTDYGREWDSSLEGQIGAHLVMDVAYADFHGAGPFPTKRVVWLYATYRY